MEVKSKWSRAAKALGLSKKFTDQELKTKIEELGAISSFALALKRYLENPDKSYYDGVLQKCATQALAEAKNSAKSQRERDEAVGKLKMLDDINLTINSILKEGDDALLLQKSLEKKYYGDRKQEQG